MKNFYGLEARKIVLHHKNFYRYIYFGYLNSTKQAWRAEKAWSLKLPSHESYTQRRAPWRARLLTMRRSAPFPLALGFNATIPTCSRVAEYPALFPVL